MKVVVVGMDPEGNDQLSAEVEVAVLPPVGSELVVYVDTFATYLPVLSVSIAVRGYKGAMKNEPDVSLLVGRAENGAMTDQEWKDVFETMNEPSVLDQPGFRTWPSP